MPCAMGGLRKYFGHPFPVPLVSEFELSRYTAVLTMLWGPGQCSLLLSFLSFTVSFSLSQEICSIILMLLEANVRCVSSAYI